MSEVWAYFEKLAGSESATCKQCGRNIKCKGSSTGGLIKHARGVHNLEIPTAKNPEKTVSSSATATSSQSPAESSSAAKRLREGTILSFVKRESMQEIVSRMAALDGFTISGITKSQFIRESLAKRSFKLPKDKKNVMNLVHSYFETAKKEFIAEIQTLKDGKFCLTLDEWTSFRNRRYLNVNIHSVDGVFFNLGIIRIKSTCPAEVVEELTEEKLKEFELSLFDIVGVTSDGAAVMVKFGRQFGVIHQLCYNHGFHLAVVDVIFKRAATQTGESDMNSNERAYICDDEDSDSDDNDSDCESDEESSSSESGADENIRPDIKKNARNHSPV